MFVRGFLGDSTLLSAVNRVSQFFRVANLPQFPLIIKPHKTRQVAFFLTRSGYKMTNETPLNGSCPYVMVTMSVGAFSLVVFCRSSRGAPCRGKRRRRRTSGRQDKVEVEEAKASSLAF